MPHRFTGRLAAALFATTLSLPASSLDILTLEASGAQLRAEVASSPEALTRGLMNRDSLCKDCGMLFIYPKPGQWCMWMKNTRIPLSIAFVSGEGRIMAIEEMAPGSTELHCAAVPVPYGLEASPAWFREPQIKPGDTLQGLPRAR